MKRVLGIILLLVCSTAGAEVFKQVNPDGSVSFSDTPSPGAERVQLAPAQSVSLPPAPVTVTGSVAPAAPKNMSVSYHRLAIVEPTEGQGVRANNDNVSIALELQPALAPGHTIELAVSGEGGEKILTGTSLRFQLNQLSRGRHTVKAWVRNGRGEKVKESPGVSFYVLRVAAGG